MWLPPSNVRCASAPSPWQPSAAFSPPPPSPNRSWMNSPTCIVKRLTRCCAKTRSVHVRPATTSICSYPRHPPMKPRPKKNRKTNATKTTPSLRDQILADFATLRIPVTADQLDAALAEAEKAGWSHLDFLHHLLADQAGLRRER